MLHNNLANVDIFSIFFHQLIRNKILYFLDIARYWSKIMIFTAQCCAWTWLCCRKMSLCPSVSLSDTYFMETAKHIIKLSSPSGGQTILVFQNKRYGNIPTGTPNTDVECSGMKNGDFQPLALSRMWNKIRDISTPPNIPLIPPVLGLHAKLPKLHTRGVIMRDCVVYVPVNILCGNGVPVNMCCTSGNADITRRWHVTISCQPDGRPPQGFVYSADADADGERGCGRGRGLCVFGKLWVDMWRLVHQRWFLLFLLSFDCF